MSPGPVPGLVPVTGALLLTCLLGAGCGSGAGDAAGNGTSATSITRSLGVASASPDSAATAPAPGSAAVPAPSTGQGDSMITFGVEGGFAAQLRSLQISPDGELVAEISGRRSTGHLSKAELAAIVAALDASGLFDADRSYPAPSNAADLQRYEITYRGHTVVAYDTTIPRPLDAAVRILNAALRAVG